VKILAFTVGVCFAAVGIIGIFVPSVFVWLAQHFITSGSFYIIATIRIAFGLIWKSHPHPAHSTRSVLLATSW